MKVGRRSPGVGCHEADFPSAADANPATAAACGGTDSFVQDIPAVVDPRGRDAERRVTS